MNADDPSRLAAAFDELAALGPAERVAALAALRARDRELAGAVDDLLGRAARAGDFLEQPVFDALSDFDALLDDATPNEARIGPYRLGKPIAHGGMGVVYEAWQDQPRRRVALKLLRAGLPASAARRFELEAEILARLSHPGIAQVIDAGLHTPPGLGLALPWFAMEFLEGASPLTHHARDAGLTLRGRLALFAQVCDAVHHGHLRGVVHRDLKPGNILVDAQGRLKVIDFGVARVLDADAPLGTAATLPGELVGTLHYMSPEQREGRVDQIDARSDVYALGVVLFELLTGERPHRIDESSFVAAGIALRDATPRALSSVTPALRGDLDTIVSVAMAHDPARRYASAEALARDLRHFLAHEPLEVRPPGTIERLRLFARRRRALAASLAVAVLALMGGTAFAWHGLLRARDAEADALSAAERAGASEAEARTSAERARVAELRALAEAERARLAARDAEWQRTLAEQARAEAEDRLAESSAVTSFLEEMLGAAHPFAVDPDVTVRETLVTGAALARERFAQRPVVLARVLYAIGHTLAGLGEHDTGRTELLASLDLRRDVDAPDPRAEIETLLALAGLEVAATDPRAAARWLDEARVRYAQFEAEAEAEAEAETATDTDTDTDTGTIPRPSGDLALDLLQTEVSVLRVNGDLDEALRIGTELVARCEDTLPVDAERTRDAMTSLATVLTDLGRYADAATLLAEVVTRERADWQGRNARLAEALNNLGLALNPLGRVREAEQALREGLATLPEGLPPDHLLRGAITNNLAEVLARQDRLTEAEVLYRQVVAQHLSAGRLDSLDGALTLHNLAECLLDQGHLEEALDEEARALAILERVGAPGFFGTEIVRSGLGWILALLGEVDAARDALQTAHERLASDLGADDPRTRQAAERLDELRAALVRLEAEGGRLPTRNGP